MNGAANHGYVRRETIVSVAINSVLSLIFYVIMFGGSNPVAVWGPGGWLLDFLPQSFMIALMSTLVPGALAARKLARGKLTPLAPPSRLPGNLVVRALSLALASMIAGSALMAAATWLAGIYFMPASAALPLKIGYGALLAAIVTPLGLRAALSRRHDPH